MYQIETKDGIIVVKPEIRAMKGYTTKACFKAQMNLLKEL